MVTLGFYPAAAWGGPVKIVHQISKELVKRGHEVTVCCTNLLDKRSKIQPGTFSSYIDGIHVIYFKTVNLSWWPGTLGPVWSFDLTNWSKTEVPRYDVIHLHGSRNLINIPISRTARKANIPIVLQPHGDLQIIVNSYMIKRLYDQVLGDQEIKGISALIALQETEQQDALNRGIPANAIEIIHNGLENLNEDDSPERGSFRSAYHIPLDKPLLLFLGRINRKKGVDMLVEAFSRMQAFDAHLAIVGPDDGQMEQVKRLILQYQLGDRVTVPGLLTGKNVISAYLDADLFVLPCRNDTFPTTVLEACQAQLPMVVTEGCECAYLIDKRVGDVVPFDAVLFANAMQKLLSDRPRYQQYKANCINLYNESFSLQATVDKLEALYARVSSGPMKK
jgi:glycosyltransferase involved in cell wall biosynthesis